MTSLDSHVAYETGVRTLNTRSSEDGLFASTRGQDQLIAWQGGSKLMRGLRKDLQKELDFDV